MSGGNKKLVCLVLAATFTTGSAYAGHMNVENKNVNPLYSSSHELNRSAPWVVRVVMENGQGTRIHLPKMDSKDSIDIENGNYKKVLLHNDFYEGGQENINEISCKPENGQEKFSVESRTNLNVTVERQLETIKCSFTVQ